jgi:pantoate--beta-alanine ligase
MKTIKTITGLKEERKKYRDDTVGFVPTMGYLHQGHLSLVEQSKKENDITFVSIFVNPTQFAPTEDFTAYPRDLQKDENILRELGVDLVFYPDAEEIYPPGYATYVDVEKMSSVLCGKSRPTHFRGVATVVLKLFNIVTPDNAYFGQKDAQQVILLKRMTADLNLDVSIKTKPIVRDPDGLAMSSRNVYLSAAEREAALQLPRALRQAKDLIENGLSNVFEIKAGIENELKKSPLVTIDYVEVVTLDQLQQVSGYDIDTRSTLVAAAVRVGKTRLIDNFILGEL